MPASSSSNKKKRRAPAETSHGPGRFPAWLIALAVVVVAFAAYFPALNGGLLWDDESWTTNIEPLLRDGSGLWKMWSDPRALQQYYPLTGTTFWIDYQCWRWWTLPCHVENLLLHLAAALLFWRVLLRLQVAGAWLGGVLFAIHPVMVESVAWITERKNVLSLVLFLAAALAYLKFAADWVAEENSKKPRAWGAYAAALVWFVLALLAKVTAFAFPPVLLVLCWWKRGTIRWRQDVLPLLPFFAISVGFGLGISWLETHTVGASGPDWAWTWPQRFLIAGRALWFYAVKVFCPVGQSFIYPQWNPDTGAFFHWLMLAAAAAVFVVLWAGRSRWGRGPLAAACIFAGTLFPVLGFMNVYGMRFSVVADHWVYVSSLPLLALAAAGLVSLRRRLGGTLMERGAVTLLVALLAMQSWRQSHQYRDMEALWRTTLEKNPGCWMAHNNFGNLLGLQGHLDEAVAHFQQALNLRPAYAEAHNNLGEVLQRRGSQKEYEHELERALVEFHKAVELDPGAAPAHYNLASALLQQGQLDESITEFQKAIAIKENYHDAHNNLGVALVQKGRIDEAISHYQRSLKFEPKNVEAMVNLGAALFAQGKAEEAVRYYEQALALQPDHSGAHNNLGTALLQLGRVQDAMPHFQRAIELRPQSPEAHGNLAKCLAENQKYEEAISHYETAVKLRPDYGDAQYGLGLALSRTGRLKEAVRHYELAVECQPKRADARINLGNLLVQLGEVPAAIKHLEQAVVLEPETMLSHNSFGNALLQAGQTAAAAAEFELALKISPDNWVVLNNLAWILATSADATVRDGYKAVSLARKAVRLAGEDNPFVLRTLAAAYAEDGKFAEAADTAVRARRMAVAQGNDSLAESAQAALQLYQAGTPFRDLH
ncbi:tetratricopeptide repeat protein [Prosthecobacter sp.]|uniref:tetratricopeptide repeat protein n=1 Tax=Prosthecobacter sp. TaxID=1965333 RepID=UPI00378314CA